MAFLKLSQHHISQEYRQVPRPFQPTEEEEKRGSKRNKTFIILFSIQLIVPCLNLAEGDSQGIAFWWLHSLINVRDDKMIGMGKLGRA